MDKQNFKEWVELASRVGALGLGLVYCIGFLVVTIHNAEFGFVEFDLFRARVLSAGILFTIFFILAAWEAIKAFRLFGLSSSTSEEDHGKRPIWSRLFAIQAYFIESMASAFFLRLFLGDDKFGVVLIVAFLSYFALFAAIAVSVRGRPVPFYSLATILVVGFVATMILDKQWTILSLLGWFVVVGWMTYQMDAPLRQTQKLLQVNWLFTLCGALSLLAIFTILIYPKIGPQLGGGKPTSITVQFFNPSPIDKATKTDFWLVDETAAGFYVLSTSKDEKAIFLPRGLVSTLYFHSDK